MLGEAHANDGHHGQAAVGELCVEFFSAQGGVLDGGAEAQVSQAEAALAIVARLGGLLVHYELQEAGEGEDLRPALLGHNGERLKAVGHVGELQVVGWRQEAIELVVLWRDISHAGKHGHAPMLDLGLTAALEDLDVKVLRESERVPETQRRLVTSQALEARVGLLPLGQSVVARAHQSTAKGRVRIQCPVAPRGACQSILEQPRQESKASMLLIE